MRISYPFSFRPPVEGERFLDYFARGIGSRLSLLGEFLNVPWLIYNPLHFYHFETLAKKAAPIVSRTIANLFPSIRSVADIGCGTGEFAYHFSALGFRVSACENSSYGRKLAINKGLDCHPLDLSLDPPSTLSGFFDAVICFEVAEHIPFDLSHRLVEYCSSLTDFIIFTAAPPGQGGTGHISEAPFEYWIAAFKLRKMVYCEDLTSMYRALLSEELVDQSRWLWKNTMLFKRVI